MSNDILRHGYYLPAQDRLCGDQDLAHEAKTHFLSLGLNDGDVYHGSHYDGTSIFIREDGSKHYILCLQDFFADFYAAKKFKIIVFEF
jgi:hypothetical protein